MRFYKGDISGKLMLGVNFDFFDGISEKIIKNDEVVGIKYTFDERDISKIKYIVYNFREKLGDFESKIDEFFSLNEHQEIRNFGGYIGYAENSMVEDVLKIYAQMRLGEQILRYLESNKKCEFVADV